MRFYTLLYTPDTSATFVHSLSYRWFGARLWWLQCISSVLPSHCYGCQSLFTDQCFFVYSTCSFILSFAHCHSFLSYTFISIMCSLVFSNMNNKVLHVVTQLIHLLLCIPYPTCLPVALYGCCFVYRTRDSFLPSFIHPLFSFIHIHALIHPLIHIDVFVVLIFLDGLIQDQLGK